MKTLIAVAAVAFLAACSTNAPRHDLYQPPVAGTFANQPDDAAQGEPAAAFWRGMLMAAAMAWFMAWIGMHAGRAMQKVRR